MWDDEFLEQPPSSSGASSSAAASSSTPAKETPNKKKRRTISSDDESPMPFSPSAKKQKKEKTTPKKKVAKKTRSVATRECSDSDDDKVIEIVEDDKKQQKEESSDSEEKPSSEIPETEAWKNSTKIEDQDQMHIGDSELWRNTYNKEIKGVKTRTYGEVKGVELYAKFKDRKAVSQSGVHTPVQQGINGYGDTPAASIVAQHGGGYQDDDFGDVMIYTGQGGDKKADQTLNKYNKSLYTNYKQKTPVRVIRGYQLPSKFAPAEGYRYDGLYWVTAVWREKAKHGKLVYRFRMVRLEGYATLLERDFIHHKKGPKLNNEGTYKGPRHKEEEAFSSTFESADFVPEAEYPDLNRKAATLNNMVKSATTASSASSSNIRYSALPTDTEGEESKNAETLNSVAPVSTNIDLSQYMSSRASSKNNTGPLQSALEHVRESRTELENDMSKEEQKALLMRSRMQQVRLQQAVSVLHSQMDAEKALQALGKELDDDKSVQPSSSTFEKSMVLLDGKKDERNSTEKYDDDIFSQQLL